MPGEHGLPIEVRFMNKVKKQDSGCWEWQAYCMPRGYGMFRTSLRHELAHRISYQLFVGVLDPKLDVMHSCDNTRCVNPAHLSLGTRKDNMHDAHCKGRTAKGEKHGRSKLTEDQVRAIKKATGSQRSIAVMFGVSQPTISDIKTGQKWTHLHT